MLTVVFAGAVVAAAVGVEVAVAAGSSLGEQAASSRRLRAVRRWVCGRSEFGVLGFDGAERVSAQVTEGAVVDEADEEVASEAEEADD